MTDKNATHDGLKNILDEKEFIYTEKEPDPEEQKAQML